jgi:hypothetical protein
MKKVSEEKKAYVKKLCEEGINKIDNIFKNYSFDDEYENIPVGALKNVKDEFIKMLNTLDKRQYAPIYPRFLLDYPSSELRTYFIHIANEYDKKT